jgi:hypothetical protein
LGGGGCLDEKQHGGHEKVSFDFPDSDKKQTSEAMHVKINRVMKIF